MPPRRMGRAPGDEDHDSGMKLYWQGNRFAEAEKLFRRAAQNREEVSGSKNARTLDSSHWLALTLFEQEKHTEAEHIMMQVVLKRKKVLGTEHTDTLNSEFWLARVLYEQKKYTNAEEIFRHVVLSYENMLGRRKTKTHDSKHWLAQTLYKQKKYVEAEEMFRQTTPIDETTREDADTIESEYWLALTRYEQKKYVEAGEILRHMVQKSEQMFGRMSIRTLYSMSLLARTLYQQKKYAEAEAIFRQTIEGYEKVCGEEHRNTLNSKNWLAQTISRQISSRRMAQGPEGLARKAKADTPTPTLSSCLDGFFPENRNRLEPFTDKDIRVIASLLKPDKKRWGTVPRTYVVLRIIGCLNMLDVFIDLGFSDSMFPVTERTVPQCLRPSQRSNFLNMQHLVLSRSFDLDEGGEGLHCHLLPGWDIPFESKGILGSGGFAQVDKVLSSNNGKEYARKLVPRRITIGGKNPEYIKHFLDEIEILKRLNHQHVVEFVISYSDHEYIGLIMSPAAEMDLSTYLKHAGSDKYGELRTFFGCLAKALEFLHGQKVRHKDIKPGNILVHRGKVLFADFGLAVDFTDADRSTTVGEVKWLTQKYCAPEVFSMESRNTSSDIWSLGVVFLEMTTVLKGKTIQDVDDFIALEGPIAAYPDGLLEFIVDLRNVGSSSDNKALGWIQQMLRFEKHLRPTASDLGVLIVGEGTSGDSSFCGMCCSSPGEGDSGCSITSQESE